MSDEQITTWIGKLKTGDSQAAEHLWNEYFNRLVNLARSRLRKIAPAMPEAEAEDVALSAFHSLVFGAKNDRFPKLNDRDSLWPLLLVITARKASHAARRERAEKRGGGHVLKEAELLPLGKSGDEIAALEAIIRQEPTQELATQLEEQLEILYGQIDNDLNRRIVQLKLEGYTNQEIAENVGKSLRTVERKLELIRRIWTDEQENASELE